MHTHLVDANTEAENEVSLSGILGSAKVLKSALGHTNRYLMNLSWIFQSRIIIII